MVNSSSASATTPSDSSLWENIVNALKENKGLATVLGSAAASVVGFVLYKVFSQNKSTKKLAVSIKTATEKPVEVTTPIPSEPEWILYNVEDASGISSWKVCNQKKIGVSFKMPAQYEVEVHSQGQITTITLIDASNMNMMMGGGGDATMITIEEVPSELDIKQYMKNNVSALAQTQVPFRVLEENDHIKVNGIEACQMISELTGQQKVKIFAIAFKNPEEPNKVLMFQHIGTDMKAFESNIGRTKNIIRTVKLQKGELFGRVSYRNDKLGYILNLPSTDFLAIGSATDRALYLGNKNIETYMIHYSKEDNIDKEIVIIANDAQDFEKFVSEQKALHSSKTGYMSLGQMKIGHNNGELVAYSDKAHSYVASEKEKSEIQADYDFIEIYFQRGSNIYTILGRSLPQISEKFKVDFLTMVKKMKFFEDVNTSSGASLIYENTEFNFKISQPIKLQATAKENNSDNPVVTLLAQNDENSLPIETMVSIAEPNHMMPVSDLDGLSQLMKAELQMIQMYSGGSPVNIERDGMIKLNDGSDAFSMVYSMVDPMSNESLVMHQTGLLLPSKKIANVKSYTYQQLYNDTVKDSFDAIHKSFGCKQ